jgi:hypothetical protein
MYDLKGLGPTNYGTFRRIKYSIFIYILNPIKLLRIWRHLILRSIRWDEYKEIRPFFTRNSILYPEGIGVEMKVITEPDGRCALAGGRTTPADGQRKENGFC